jgi:hypothetical protein
MSKNIVIVTNEEGILDRVFNPLYKTYPDRVGKVNNYPTTAVSDGWCSKWVETTNEVEGLRGARYSDAGFEYNIFRIPFAGLAYMVAYCRKYNIAEKHMVVSVKELNATQAYSMDLFHLFLNSRIKIRLSLFEEYFSISEGNSFLGPMFDPIIDMIKEDRILQTSPDIHTLVD